MGDCNKCTRSNSTFGHDLNVARLTRIIRWLVIGIVVLAFIFSTAVIVSNAIWAKLWSEYDTTSYDYQQDGSGVNIIGDKNEVDYGTAVESQEAG